MKLVQRVIKKTEGLADGYTRILRANETVLSHNKVCGWSLNLPIYRTCKPTKVCVETCYYAKGGLSWDNSLRKQLRVYNSFKRDPQGMARRILMEYDMNRCTYLRWNGGGDLFEESVQAINYIVETRPDVILWIVTRKLEEAAKIKHDPNKHIHISLDWESMDKWEKYEAMPKLSANYFYSYQARKNEILDPATVEKIDILFYDNYHETEQPFPIPERVFCALTVGRARKNIDRFCESCRKCFMGKLRERTRTLKQQGT